MIRVLAGSAAVLALGLAASFVAPSLIGVPRGEPMLVAGTEPELLLPANFDEVPCAANLLLADGAPAETAPPPGVRFVALALRAGPGGLALAIEELAADAAVPAGTLVFALAPDGMIVAMWEAADFRRDAVSGLFAAGCRPQDPPVAGSV